MTDLSARTPYRAAGAPSSATRAEDLVRPLSERLAWTLTHRALGAGKATVYVPAAQLWLTLDAIETTDLETALVECELARGEFRVLLPRDVESRLRLLTTPARPR